MQAHCPQCHAQTEVSEAKPGDPVQCGACLMRFTLPIPKGGLVNPSDVSLGVFITSIVGESADDFEARIGELIGADTFESIKSRASDAFAAFMAELESDPAIDLERIGQAITELVEVTFEKHADELTAAAVPDPNAAPGDAAAIPEGVTVESLIASIRFIVREEIDEALAELSGLFDPPWPAIQLSVLDNEEGTPVTVSVDVDGVFVDVIEANLGGVISHIVEPAGIEKAVEAMRAGQKDAPAGGDQSGDDALEDLPTG